MVQAAEKAPAPGPKPTKRPKAQQQQLREGLAKDQSGDGVAGAIKEDSALLTSQKVEKGWKRKRKKAMRWKPFNISERRP